MSYLPNKLFQDRNILQQSYNYRINRFCNEIVLYFSKNCKFLKEIGIQKINTKIVLTVTAKMSNRILFEDEYQKLLQNDPFVKEYSFLKSKGAILETDIFSKSFSDSFIEKLSHYYFAPKKTKNRYLFKYLTYNENITTLLTNNSLWFSDPNSFNDPFDCRYKIDADPLDWEIIEFYYGKDNAQTQALPFEDYARAFIMPPKDQFLKDLEEHHFMNSFSKQQGVCCFTEKYDNKLMWAHYAKDATGLCLVFDTWKDVEKEHLVFSGDKVKYRNSLVKKFYDGSGYFEITDILYSKNKIWTYEHEIREHIRIEKGQTDRAVSFDPQSLVGIIYGAKMNKKHKETIKQLTSQLDKYNIDHIDSYIDLQNNSIRLKENQLKLP
ncbi:DUF2971 domain-containing protein [Pedobacter gandavensis]|uniref:DUF2971 domain-containing protein n=1 Tax=Pedobacter gandavensis TaxID=2679963 RepID=A0ABR6EUI4_9SPHI|nr:DUF2971 domain-containing protein [Pedobacter gandavensis]MBB2148926.1 DUF2971 domain-containing protein [Pedobacter gandavensis]